MAESSTGTATGEFRGEESRVKKSGNFVDKRRLYVVRCHQACDTVQTDCLTLGRQILVHTRRTNNATTVVVDLAYAYQQTRIVRFTGTRLA